MRIAARALLASAALLCLLAPPASAAGFTVTYRGAGEYRTTFAAHPPNPGGRDDRNRARDSSRQRWALAFHRSLDVPACGPPAGGGPDPCTHVTGLSGASGRTRMTARVRHRHVDGLFRRLDRTVTCRLRRSTAPRSSVQADLHVRYVPESRTFLITAGNPLTTLLRRFPTQCPEQGDSIDRIFDFYAMPGFSFAEGYGPDRWFTSREVAVPAERFERSSTIRIPLADTPAGTPPRACARLHPSYERCRTGGDWRGVLTFRRRPAAPAARVAAIERPRGRYTGDRRLVMSVAGRAIDIAAFDFRCGGTIGRTSLNGIAIRRVRGRWRFSERMYAIVTFRDGRPDVNARVRFAGRFSTTAKTAAGTFRVDAPRCPSTGDRRWTARRRSG